MRIGPKAVKAVLFDLDGVLIDSRQAWFRAIQRGRRHFGYDEIAYEAFEKTFGQGVDADRDDFFPKQTTVDVSKFYEQAFPLELGAITLLDDSPKVLRGVKARGLACAVVTNTPIALAHRILEEKGLAPHVSVVAGAGEAADKPSPELIFVALDRLSLQTDAVIYVGDSRSDLQATQAADVAFAGLGIGGDIDLQSLGDLLSWLDQ